jgi:hypothetical protein
MPIYQFQVVEDYQSPDVRWTYLSDDDAAKRYGRLLIKVTSSRTAVSSPLTPK